MSLYTKGAPEGFEAGIRNALEGILASPRFVFRFEEPPAAARAGGVYALSDLDLASRLSFFLWATGPDEELLRVAEAGRLATPAGLEQQTRRMLADRRSDVSGLALRRSGCGCRIRQDQSRCASTRTSTNSSIV